MFLTAEPFLQLLKVIYLFFTKIFVIGLNQISPSFSIGSVRMHRAGQARGHYGKELCTF